MERLEILIVSFALYSFVGWCGEVVYTYFRERRWVNRGFLSGPFFLLYGAGAILPVVLFDVESPLWLVAPVVALWSAIVEYGGSWALERIGLSYWSYNDKPFNLHGRICPESILIFTAALVALVYVIHPAIDEVFLRQPEIFTIMLATVFVLYLVVHGRRQLIKQMAWYRRTGQSRQSIP